MDIVTYEILYTVLKKLLGGKMEEEDIKDLAEYVVNFFGYGDRIIDNMLTPADRDVFYYLEELEIVKPMEEEITISKGKLWRIHYWVYRKDKIEEVLNSKPQKKKEESPEELYKRLFEEME
ncbi:hypothetical protein AciM339_0677 [Aciduliprofundum sp. MAR08-339]|uniref:DUF6015 family protein n=1 Tax=Aciduliprofundum sp. (strain MAR08-339) TaxID=673860 RepID=UPI0002A499D5|nr:hypothetical protein AciM339_0677 [Aciduliprofundum sp. MAR08-339]